LGRIPHVQDFSYAADGTRELVIRPTSLYLLGDYTNPCWVTTQIS